MTMAKTLRQGRAIKHDAHNARARPNSRKVAPRTGANVYVHSLGMDGGSAIEVIAKIQSGFPYKVLEGFEKSTSLSIAAIARLVSIPQRTLTRRKQTGRLQPDESERLFRVARVIEKAVQLFEGDREAAMRWFQTPQPALDGKKPIEFARTEVGGREVEDLIGRLEHGVFT
jgi:putative toxin-antitoxin system antitoxin component (TIGR02293 family)